MRLLEAIVTANHRALAGDPSAGLRPADYADALPLVVLTCFEPRMHPLMPEVLGVPEAQFIWITHAGNRVPTPSCGAALDVALACVVQGGREVAIIGHTNCRYCQIVPRFLGEQFQNQGISLTLVADALDAFLRDLTDESENVVRAVRTLRQSPLLPESVPVHGLLVNSDSGMLEWLVNGYPAQQPARRPTGADAPPVMGRFTPGDFKLGGGTLPPIGTVP